jgi:uncharacterized protein with HEPN domain
MTQKDDAFYLEGIREHILAIRSYLPGSLNDFLEDARTQDAVLMRLLALGEEIGRLSDSFTERHPDLKWYQIVGMRNRIAHGYFEIDPAVVWETITSGDLDELHRVVDNSDS